MKLATITTRCLAAMIAGPVLLSACSSPPARFYTLSAVGPSSVSAAGAPDDPAALAVTAVTIPGNLDRPQMVRFAAAGRVELLEEARWSEPLAHGIARTLAEDIGTRLGNAAVAAYPQDASARARYRISVDFSHLDVDLSGSVTLDAIWSIRDTYVAPLQTGAGVAKPVRTTDRLVSGHAHIAQHATGTASTDTSVQLVDDALAGLADQLAVAYRQFQALP